MWWPLSPPVLEAPSVAIRSKKTRKSTTKVKTRQKKAACSFHASGTWKLCFSVWGQVLRSELTLPDRELFEAEKLLSCLNTSLPSPSTIQQALLCSVDQTTLVCHQKCVLCKFSLQSFASKGGQCLTTKRETVLSKILTGSSHTDWTLTPRDWKTANEENAKGISSQLQCLYHTHISFIDFQ